MSFEDLVAIVRMTRRRAKRENLPPLVVFRSRHRTRHERVVLDPRAKRGA